MNLAWSTSTPLGDVLAMDADLYVLWHAYVNGRIRGRNATMGR